MTEDDCLALICKGGNARDSGMRQLYALRAQQMLRFFCRLGLTKEDAKDALQDTFLRIWRGAESHRGDGSAASWIWQIARNCLNDQLRKNHRHAKRTVDFGDQEWDQIQDSHMVDCSQNSTGDIESCVHGGLAKFREFAPDRAYVLELQMDGTRIEEIAAQIGRTTAAAKEYLSQCRKKIRPFIEHCLGFLEVEVSD